MNYRIKSKIIKFLNDKYPQFTIVPVEKLKYHFIIYNERIIGMYSSPDKQLYVSRELIWDNLYDCLSLKNSDIGWILCEWLIRHPILLTRSLEFGLKITPTSTNPLDFKVAGLYDVLKRKTDVFKTT